MTSPRRQQVACDAYVARGLDFGERMVAHYASGGSPWSRSRSGDRGTERDPLRLAQGKIGECAAAIVCGLDPADAVKWTVGRADPGWDIRLAWGTLADVKTTSPEYRLIWSRTVNDLYDCKRFDVLVAVSIDPGDFGRCWVEGWETKADFLRRKRVADSHNSRLEPDTWFMDKADLRPVQGLLAFDAMREIERRRVELDAALQDLEDELPPPFQWLPDRLVEAFA